jgi:predicted Rossmann-fold nucleotide-binding protein
MDEFFETLTLLQTGKIDRPLPLVLYGASFWSRVLHLDAMVDEGTISPEDPGLFLMTDSLDEAFEYVVSALESVEAGNGGS